MQLLASRSPIRFVRAPCLALSLLVAACGWDTSEGAGEFDSVVGLDAESAAGGQATPGQSLSAGQEPLSSGYPGRSLILITIDTLRRDHLSLHGYRYPTSPSFEALQGELLVFDHALSTSPWTMPSIASLFTGLHPSGHGGHGQHAIRDDVPLLAETFGAAGYRTAAFSANPYVSSRYGLARGFQDFFFLGGAKASAYPDLSEIVAAVRSWLDENAGEPFFLYLHVMNVHGPYQSAESYEDRFVDGPTQPFEFQSELWLDIAQRGRKERRADVTEEHLRDIRGRYDRAIAYTDSLLGEFVEELRARGVLDDSILVVTSDHGEEFFEHGSFGHRHALHAELLDIPLIIRLPGGRMGGVRITEPVSLIDVPPTVLDLVGLLDRQHKGEFGVGRSLVPLLDGNPLSGPPRALLAELALPKRSGSMVQLWPHRLIQVSSESAPRLYRVDHGAWQRVDPTGETAPLIEHLRKLGRGLLDEAGDHVGADVALPDDETLRGQLEALGYLETEASPGEASSRRSMEKDPPPGSR